ncbi:MAG: efflux RND transporter permease subunit, partial [Pseudomonadota bacterium]|nr:efflux RND transporter permease subunit [Pseudomonadota bacterium]
MSAGNLPEPVSRAHASLTRPGLSEWFIRHPIGTTLLTVGIVLLGIVAFPLLAVAPMPEAELPTMQISANLPGASPETMASAVATPLEVQLSSVPGITDMTSSSSLGTTNITLQFVLTKDIDVAAQEVQAAINAASGRLPSDLPNLPTWRKVNPNDGPILVVRMQSDLMTLTELSDIAETVVGRQLSQIDGVAETPINGQRKPAMRIQAAPEKLASLGLTLADLRQSIQAASVNQAKGALFGADRVSTLQTNDQIFTTQDYDGLIVAYRDDAPVFLRDVANVTFGAENEYVQAWQNGKPGIHFVIRRQPGANIVATADRIRAALPQLQQLLPASLELEVINDRTRTIRASLHEVAVTLVVTFLLVVVVMGVFLRQLAATAIV